MARKKNKKGNKLARMNDEEKLRYLQHRAAVEEETRRRKEQLVAAYLKNKLKKEEAFARLNTAKLNQQWRHNLRQIKCKELKDEMVTMENRFEILLDCKNRHIDMLLKDLEDAEEQNLKQYGAHVEIISQFLELHKRCLEELRDRYDGRIRTLVDELKGNFGRMRDVFARDDRRLELMSVVFETRNDDDTRRTHGNFEDSIAILNNEMLFEKDRFAKIRFAEMRTTVMNMEKVLDDYGGETESKKNHYNYLKTRDEANTAAIEENDKRIREYSDEIKTLTGLCVKREAEYARRENDLNAERDGLVKRGLAAQKRLSSDQKTYGRKLEAMTKVYKKVTDKLCSIAEKGERILKTAENCANLMTDDDSDMVAIAAVDRESGDADDDDELRMWTTFWKRCARAESQCRGLDAKRARLSRDNEDLRAALAYYLRSAVAGPASARKDGGCVQLNLLPVKAG